MSVNQTAPIPVTKTVTTTPLFVFGSSNWATDDDTSDDYQATITNNGTTDLYVLVGTQGAASSVSSTVYEKVVYAGSFEGFLVKAGQNLQVVRASGTGNVTARRYQ